MMKQLLRSIVVVVAIFEVSSFSMPPYKTIYGIPNSGWTSPEWNWGYASGTGHDCAAICRRKYATRIDRIKLIEDLLSASSISDLEEIKLVMALAWQRGRWDGSDGGSGGYGDVLSMMADARRYENGSDGKRFLFFDMQERFYTLRPSDDDDAAMKNLTVDGNDFDQSILSCSGLVLKAMGFIENGI